MAEGSAAPPRRVVLVHGFTQTARSWQRLVAALAPRLGDAVELVAVDAPGHGARGDVHVDLAGGARLLATEAGPGTWIGYSMGARLCLHVALERPDVVERLVLLSGTAGIEDDGARAERRAADKALADELERIGVDDFLDRWLAQPLFASLQPDPDDVVERRRNTAAGLASSLRLAGTGAQDPLWSRLAEIPVPVLVVAGELDAKFMEIGRRMADALPAGRFESVAAAGHAAHLERPAAVADVIARWLTELSA